MDDRTPVQSWAFLSIVSVLFLTACNGSSDSASKNTNVPVTYENIVIQCISDCSSVAQKINNTGGNVYKSYRNVPAIAATVPASLVDQLQVNSGVKNINKDILVTRPNPRHFINLRNVISSEKISSINLNSSTIGNYLAYLPKNYNFNNVMSMQF